MKYLLEDVVIDVEEEYENKELYNYINDIISKLDFLEKRIIQMSFYSKYKVKEICDELNINSSLYYEKLLSILNHMRTTLLTHNYMDKKKYSKTNFINAYIEQLKEHNGEYNPLPIHEQLFLQYRTLDHDKRIKNLGKNLKYVKLRTDKYVKPKKLYKEIVANKDQLYYCGIITHKVK